MSLRSSLLKRQAAKTTAAATRLYDLQLSHKFVHDRLDTLHGR